MKNISNKIDHTNLKPTATILDIEKLCKEALEHHFVAVCVAPTYVSLVKHIVKEKVKVCTVIGFPFGNDETVTKIAAIKQAVSSGVDELDVVVNIGRVKSGDWDFVSNEIDQLVTMTKHKYGKILKLIFETAYLTKDEVSKLCEICNTFGVDYAKTSTGFAQSGASVDTVTLMRSLLKDKIKIKASGGIGTFEKARELISAGADRIGASKSLLLISQ